jgi:4-amino-4-deoxy-L-arabinose transferase-like glycosyltransferase
MNMKTRTQNRSVSSAAALRKRYWWPLIMGLALVSYLYGLGGFHIPKIGDEAPYIQIVRLTAASGHWLPLKALPGLEDTKPPLLFWQGLLATDQGTKWSLLRLRFPIVFCTFLTAGLVFLLARRLADDSEPGYLAALSFLGCFSTFQHGRPFLTNMPETLFSFLPIFLMLYRRDTPDSIRLPFWVASGLSFGMAFLYKSFALVAPLSLALAWICLARRRWAVKEFLRRDVPGITVAMLIGLAGFTLWPLLDPDPKAVLNHFVWGQNVSKLSSENYFAGLFVGSYTVFRIWLGNLANAGFLALPLIALVAIAVRQRARLRAEEKALWIFVLSFTVFYTIPAQRQENYLLPTVPALAVLLGVGWKSLPQKAFYAFAILPLLAVVSLMVITYSISFRFLPAGYYWWQLIIVLCAFLSALVTLCWNRVAPHLFHLDIMLLFLSLSCALAPFHGPLGNYSNQTVAALKGKTVYIPSNFRSSYERHRFLLPGAEIEGYDQRNKEQQQRLLDNGAIVAVNRPFGEFMQGQYDVFGSCLTMRSRHTSEEIINIVLRNQLDLLIQQEIIVRRASDQAPPCPANSKPAPTAKE